MSSTDSSRVFLRMRNVSIALAPIAALSLAGAAQSAELPTPDLEWQIGVATENVAKGLGKSGGDPSVSGSVGASLGAFYAEFSGSTVELGGGADSELVTTVGYAPEIGGFEFDFSAMHKVFTGTVPGYDDRFMEYQADVSRDVGPVGVRLRANYTPDGSGSMEDAWWFETQASYALGARTRASVAVGERVSDTSAEYTAWNVGVKHKLTRQLAADVRWYDTDQHDLGDRYEGRLVGALTYAF
ncbi:TorF family putative porin [Brevundimonas viscosa]|uniref:Outer membrane protein beta-barrel domain-containing protein n=1 Tax=Brevundimonas viscosa TaxID=871741 RepID=A0A1I6TB96_9CAUL|nr:TorF family putative porin [Brevundimonas viscosa]SFS86479.1 conserved hypothetical protein [Brevundimonas viscosa]